HHVIRPHVLRERLRIGVPLGRPVLHDPEADAGWMYLLTHSALSGLLVTHGDRDVAVPLEDPRAAPLGTRPVPPERRSLVHLDDRNLELVDVRAVIVLRVRNRRLQYLLHDPGTLAGSEGQRPQRLVHALATDRVGH